MQKASAQQRKGRAGRVREGFCFRMYTQSRFDSWPAYSIPEMLRVSLEELCLHIKVFQVENSQVEIFLGMRIGRTGRFFE